MHHTDARSPHKTLTFLHKESARHTIHTTLEPIILDKTRQQADHSMQLNPTQSEVSSAEEQKKARALPCQRGLSACCKNINGLFTKNV